jgi:hypothetical protein
MVEESNVLVSYLTRNNTRLGSEEVHFVDCGGNPGTFLSQSQSDTPTYPDSHQDYVEYVAEQTTAADRWALRDYPVTDSVRSEFDMTVKELQHLTTGAHRNLLNRAEEAGVESTPVSVVQGETIRDYLSHLDQLEAAGALTDTVAIGSIAMRSPEVKQEIICAIREALSPVHSIHGFGVSLQTLKKDGVVAALDSADSGGWLSQRRNTDHPAWDDDAAQGLRPSLYEYLEYSKSLGEILTASHCSGSGALSQYTTSKSPNIHLSNETQRAVDAYQEGDIRGGAEGGSDQCTSQASVSEFGTPTSG